MYIDIELLSLEVFEPIIERSYLRADTLPPFDYYQENCLIVQKSKKWIHQTTIEGIEYVKLSDLSIDQLDLIMHETCETLTKFQVVLNQLTTNFHCGSEI